MRNRQYNRLFKNYGNEAQERFKADAYLEIREDLKLVQQQRYQGFFNSLIRSY